MVDLKKGDILQQKSLRVNVDTFTRSMSVQNSWMKGQPHSLANYPPFPQGDSNSFRPAAKTGLLYLICDAANFIKIWPACARHEIQYKA